MNLAFALAGAALHVSAITLLDVEGPSRFPPSKRQDVTIADSLDHELDSLRFQSTITSSNLLRHANQFLSFSHLSGYERSFGTTGNNATIEYIAGLLRSTGYFDVELQTFSMEDQLLGNPRLSVNGVEYRGGVTKAFPSVQGEGEVFGDASGEVVRVANVGCELANFPPSLEGKIALIKAGGDAWSCPGFKVGTSKSLGAVGAIIYNDKDTPLGTIGLFYSIPNRPTNPFVPTIGISGVDAERILELLEKGEKVVASLHAGSGWGTAWGPNLIATTKTGDRDNIVMAGAHADSVWDGPGMNDNGSGSISLLEIALNLPTQGTLTNAIRFGWWNAEEKGLVGSAHYVNSLSDLELQKIALYLNFDMVASPNPGYFVMDGDASDSPPPDSPWPNFPYPPGPPGSGHIEQLFTDYYKTVGIQVQSSAQDGRSDYKAFGLAGVPMGSFDTGNAQIKTVEQAALWGGTPDTRFDSCYHKVCDDANNLNVTSWVLNTKAAAHAIATYANSLEGIPRPRPAASSIRRRSEAVSKGVCSGDVDISIDCLRLLVVI